MEPKNEHSDIVLNENAIEHLRHTRKWSNLIAVIGFLVIGIMLVGIIGVILFASRFDQNGLLEQMAVYQFLPIAVLILIYGIPIYYLYQFGKYSKKALNEYDSDSITIAFKFLKLHYRFMGILLILLMLFYSITIALFTFHLWYS